MIFIHWKNIIQDLIKKIDKAYLEGRYGGVRYLVQLIRSFSEEGWSNPKKILDRVIENLRESKEQFISYESLLNRIMDYLYETKVLTTSKILARNIWKTMLQTCDKKSKNQRKTELIILRLLARYLWRIYVKNMKL